MAAAWIIGAAALLLACTASDKGGASLDDTGPAAPDPWLDLADVPLDPFRSLMRVPLPQAVAPQRLLSLGDVPLTWVQDDDAGQLWGLDARYRHDPDHQCVDISLWPDLDDGSRNGPCGEGKVFIDRGSTDPGSNVIAAAVDPSEPGLWMLGTGGELAFANADPLVGNPLDYLRPATVATLFLRDGPWRLAADGHGGVWLSAGDVLSRFDGSGERSAEVALGEEVLALAADREGEEAWILTPTRLVRSDGVVAETVAEVDGTGAHMVLAEDGIWLTLPADARVRAPDGTLVDVEGLTGPLAMGPAGLWVAVEEGVARLVDGVEVDRHGTDPVVDLVVQDTGEVVLLHADATVAVHVDETDLAGPPAVQAAILSFLENPKPTGEDHSQCPEPDAIAGALDQARDNSRLLEDLPAEVALGIIPEVSLRAKACGLEEALAEVWDRPRRSPGLFFAGEQHVTIDSDADLDAFLSSQAAQHQALGLPIRWVGGPARFGDLGLDWVAALGRLGVAEDTLVFGLDILPEVSAWDPRTKEPWPWLGAAPRTAWRPVSADDPLAVDPDGPVVMRPGSTTSLFTLGTCANLFIFECKQSNLGGDALIDDGDLGVLSLDLWRALAVRSDGGSDHWYFHLPSLDAFDYTDGCRREDRVWTGDDCQARLLQDWVFDVQARYVHAGLVQWWEAGG